MKPILRKYRLELIAVMVVIAFWSGVAMVQYYRYQPTAKHFNRAAQIREETPPGTPVNLN